MHSQNVLRNDLIHGLSASEDGKNKITFENITCQLFIIL